MGHAYTGPLQPTWCRLLCLPPELSLTVAERQRAGACCRSIAGNRTGTSTNSGVMPQSNEAVKSFVYAQTDHAAVVDHQILERAAEALYEFVFSGCGRNDGKRCWARCDEETKEGFKA